MKEGSTSYSHPPRAHFPKWESKDKKAAQTPPFRDRVPFFLGRLAPPLVRLFPPLLAKRRCPDEEPDGSFPTDDDAACEEEVEGVAWLSIQCMPFHFCLTFIEICV